MLNWASIFRYQKSKWAGISASNRYRKCQKLNGCRGSASIQELLMRVCAHDSRLRMESGNPLWECIDDKMISFIWCRLVFWYKEAKVSPMKKNTQIMNKSFRYGMPTSFMLRILATAWENCQNYYDRTYFISFRRHSVYCLVDELRQVSFCSRWRKKNILSGLHRRKKKDVVKLVFYHENRQIPYDLSTFLIKYHCFSSTSEEKIKKHWFANFSSRRA